MKKFNEKEFLRHLSIRIKANIVIYEAIPFLKEHAEVRIDECYNIIKDAYDIDMKNNNGLEEFKTYVFQVCEEGVDFDDTIQKYS